jgi:hypothetical protein
MLQKLTVMIISVLQIWQKVLVQTELFIVGLEQKNTIDFLGFWEQLKNPNFKLHEFVYFKNNAGGNSFNPSITEWIEKTKAVSLSKV